MKLKILLATAVLVLCQPTAYIVSKVAQQTIEVEYHLVLDSSGIPWKLTTDCE